MATYLLNWNPESYPAEKFLEYFGKFERGESLKWSCGTTKKIESGDLFFLIKNGKKGKGIIGSGTIISEPYRAAHYDTSKADAGKEALFVDIRFNYLVKPDGAIPILRSELNAAEYASTVWDTQGSGKTISDSIASALYILWKARVPIEEIRLPEEIEDPDDSYVEGAKKKIYVNAYERNPDVRRKCLNKWGYNCTICNFHFELFYGQLGKGYIHVHHLQPLSSLKESHIVDPASDLRPVCPNCHAMLHAKTPPLPIEELQALVKNHARNRDA